MISNLSCYEKGSSEQKNIKEVLSELFKKNLTNDEYKNKCEEINKKLKYFLIDQTFLYPHPRTEIFLGNYIFDFEDKIQSKICDLSFSIEDKLTVFHCRYVNKDDEIIDKFCLRTMFLREPEKYGEIFEYCENLYNDCGFVPEYSMWKSLEKNLS